MLKDALQDLGFTDYECQAIEALYAIGKAKVTKISRASGIPKAKIYRILDRLNDKRLIRIHSTKPKEYGPIDPEKFFKRLEELQKENYARKTRLIESAKEESINELKKSFGSEQDTQQDLLDIISTGENSLSQTRQMIRSATKTICIMSQSLEYLDAIENELDEATKHCNVKIILSNPKTISSKLRKIQKTIADRLKRKDLEVKFSDHNFHFRYTIVDPNIAKTCGCLLVVKEKNIPVILRKAIYSENENFTMGILEHFNSFWN